MALTRFSADLLLSHQRRWPDRPLRIGSALWLLVVSPGLWLLFVHRLSYWWAGEQSANRHGGWRRYLIGIPIGALEWLCKVCTKSDILEASDIEGGVSMDNQGCIILGAKRIGSGTVIGPRTTIGMSLGSRGLPDIGCNVWIGSDCVVHGTIRIGDGATLLPGTTLSKNIPSGVVMQGNPARLVLGDFDNTPLRMQPNLDSAKYIAAIRST
jgi:serine acetyltransferase